jgi:hypothetical protein
MKTVELFENEILTKLGLTSEDIFPIKREDSKEDLDAVSYINIKGYLDTDAGQQTLSISLYHNDKKTIKCEMYNRATKDSVRVPAK